MIINVRGCTNKSGIIVSYLVKNEEKTGYSSFNAKRLMIKNRTDILAAIKKTLILTRKIPVIKANTFVSTIEKVSRKTICDTSTKVIVKAINEENMLSRMLSLSYIRFNNKPLPQIKAINIVNGNMYFMIKKRSDYILELIENEKIECMISIGSLVNLYRIIKQKKNVKGPPKNFSKAMYTTRFTVNTAEDTNRRPSDWRNSHEAVYVPTPEPITPTRQAEPIASPVETRGLVERPNSIDNNIWLSQPVYNLSSEEIVPRFEAVISQPERPIEAETQQDGPERPITEREQPNQARESNQDRHGYSEEERPVVRPTTRREAEMRTEETIREELIIRPTERETEVQPERPERPITDVQQESLERQRRSGTTGRTFYDLIL